MSFLQYFITYVQKHPETRSVLSENLLSQIYNFIRYIFYLPNNVTLFITMQHVVVFPASKDNFHHLFRLHQ